MLSQFAFLLYAKSHIASRGEIEKMEKEILETEEYEKQKMSNMEEINERFEF